MAAPTPDELELLKTFRCKIADLALQGQRANDMYLLSWVRARDGDLGKAEDMLRKSVEWRRVNDMEAVLEWTPPAEFQAELPFQISGFDKEGCPVGILPFGAWDVRKFIESGQRDAYIRYNDHFFEKLIESTQKTEESFTRFVIVFDLEGYSLRQLTGRGCVDTALEVVKRFEANYPERLKMAYLINAPRVFSILFSLIRPLLSARTLGKVQIWGPSANKWRLALLNNVPADQLPVKYGGTQEMAFNLVCPDGGGDGDADGSIEVTVGAGEKLEVQYEIRHAKSKLGWRFKTDGFDIGFAVRYGGAGQEVVPYRRAESHAAEEVGSLTCDQAGTYTLVFDNAYSLVRPKQLSYMVSIELPDGVEADEEESTCL